MNLMKDIQGNTSSTRICQIVLLISIVALCFYSVFTGNDLGNNICDLLSMCFIGCELKKGSEFISKRLK